MADTIRTKSALAGLFPDNVIGDISPQDLRDFLVSVMGSMTITTVSTATYTVVDNDDILHVTRTASGACTITIPSTLIATSTKVITIKDAGFNSSNNHITIVTEGSEKIENSVNNYVMSSNGNCAQFYSDGTDLFIK